MKSLLAFGIAFSALVATVTAADTSLYDIPVKTIDGKNTDLSAYRGKVLLIVNVASKCGLTPQYTALEALQQAEEKDGLVVLGFPCNQFGGQEPGTPEEIKTFCKSKYNVTFPLFEKIDVNGPARHPLYVWLAGPDAAFPGDIPWNFGKFLIGRDGKVIARFEPKIEPGDPEVLKALKTALAQKL